MLLAAVFWMLGDRTPLIGIAAPVVSLVFSAFTAFVLVIDLERPERFYYILTRPNWTSWLARGAFLLTGHAGVVSLWIALYLMGWTGALVWVAPFAILLAFGATVYTGFLFAQGLARDLWQGPHNTIDLAIQAAAEGSAALILTSLLTGGDPATLRALGLVLAFSALGHLLILVFEHLLSPSPTLNHELAVRAVRHGVYRRLFFFGALGLGGVAPLALVGAASALGFPIALLVLAALVALAGSLAWQHVWVDAGQSVPNS
jgi:formate-dependent nitrite reductase membrane component NrfD